MRTYFFSLFACLLCVAPRTHAQEIVGAATEAQNQSGVHPALAAWLPIAPPLDEASFQKGVSRTVPANDVFGATVRVGGGEQGVQMQLRWADGKTDTITFRVTGTTDQRTVKKDGADVVEDFQRPDAVIAVDGLSTQRLNYHVRPLMRRYRTPTEFTATYHEIAQSWDALPAASTHALQVELRRTAQGVDVYLGGRFAGSVAGTRLAEATFIASPQAAIGATFSRAEKIESARYLPLDVAALRMAKTFSGVQSVVTNGSSESVRGIPMRVAQGAGSADIGLTREGQGMWALEVDEYSWRSPFDGFLNEVHFAVPGGAPYTKAWVLCAADDDPKKDPIFTTRLTRYLYAGTGYNNIADTTVRLPRGAEKPAKGVVAVGEVRQTENGKTRRVPLYLVEVPLDAGKILDHFEAPWLNFEFFGKKGGFSEQDNAWSRPDPKSVSAVQVFGVTLERAPVSLGFVQAQPANVFDNDETPRTTAVLKSFAPSRGTLSWQVFDADGKALGSSSAPYQFSAAGQQETIEIPLRVSTQGWYELRVGLRDQNGTTLLTHPASFAVLGKDERQAGYESPFSIWWFDGVHHTPRELSFGASVLKKAGVRRVAWPKYTEAQMQPWGLTKTQVNIPFGVSDLQNPEAGLQNVERVLTQAIADYPHLREVILFHESFAGSEVPQELLGIKPDNLTPERIALEKHYADVVNIVGPFMRRRFPQLKIVVGNSGISAPIMAAILRHGGKPEYIDAIGIEVLGQMFTPEKLQEGNLQGMQMTRDVARVLTGHDIPLTATYEFTGRSDRDLGERQQAEWHARDVLISLSNGFSTVGMGLLFDVGSAYYHTPWGATGLMRRAPWGYPKQAYVAQATLTRVLDRATFARQIPTGSTTVYAVEFNRADGQKVVALWASRGEVDFQLSYGRETSATIVKMLGETRAAKTSGKVLTVRAGTSPAYVLAPEEIASIALRNRRFPKDERRALLSRVAAPLNDAASMTIDEGNVFDSPKTYPMMLPIRQRGKFAVRSVRDEQKGAALEVELKTDATPDLNKYITEYTTLRLKTPAPIAGEPAALGVWVKGNSSWGRVMFEFQDAKGETWKGIGAGGWGIDILDWPGNLALNYDGWSFLSLPLRETKLFNDHSAGSVLDQWVSAGGDRKIDFPIKLTALIVETNRTALDLTDFKKTSPTIRLTNFGGIYEP